MQLKFSASGQILSHAAALAQIFCDPFEHDWQRSKLENYSLYAASQDILPAICLLFRSKFVKASRYRHRSVIFRINLCCYANTYHPPENFRSQNKKFLELISLCECNFLSFPNYSSMQVQVGALPESIFEQP